MIKVVLFDIDGTLLRAGIAPRKAFQDAVSQIWRKNVNIDNISFLGKTDISILSEILKKHGLKDDSVLRQRFWSLYIQLLKDYIKKENKKRVMPGVLDILEEIKNRGITLGIITGNIRKGALIKLDTFGLSFYFSFGAFGDEKERREDLVPIAIKRAKAVRREKLKKSNFLMVGDSIPDILSGKKHGIKTVIVGTGWETKENLLKHKPFLYIEDFIKGKEEFLNLISPKM